MAAFHSAAVSATRGALDGANSSRQASATQNPPTQPSSRTLPTLRALRGPVGAQALKKASRSALMVSAWVVAMPCGKPL